MPLREMNREQAWLLPPTLDEHRFGSLPSDDPDGEVNLCKNCGLPTEFYDDGDEPCFIQYELKAQDGTVFIRPAVQRYTRAGSGVNSINVDETVVYSG